MSKLFRRVEFPLENLGISSGSILFLSGAESAGQLFSQQRTTRMLLSQGDAFSLAILLWRDKSILGPLE